MDIQAGVASLLAYDRFREVYSKYGGANQPDLNPAERRIASAVADDVYRRVSEELAVSLRDKAATLRQHETIAETVLRSLPERDREILTRFYLMEETTEAICKELGLTKTQFRLLKSQAKARFNELGRMKLAQQGRSDPSYSEAALEESAPILARAIEVFGSSEVAIRWMRQPNPALRMKTPLEAITASKGRNEVMAILGRIEHGVIS